MATQARDLIMWVGSKPYPSWRSFADEAKIRGVSKRVRAVPKGIQIGVSRVFLLHGARVTTHVESTAHSYMKITDTCHYCGVARITNSQNPGPCKVHKIRHHEKPLKFLCGYFVIEKILTATEQDAAYEEVRGCGSLEAGAIYLRGPLTEYPEPKPWPGNTFVGFRYYTEASP